MNEEKENIMRAISEEVKRCRKCDLWKTRRNAVPGEGNLNAIVVFIGEAPGYWEDLKGRPFVGAAGKLLDEALGKIGLSRNEVYITNVLKCRPPENRDPHPSEVETCRQYMDRQLETIQPHFITTLGRHSTAYIFSKMGLTAQGITKVRGKIYEVELWGSKVRIHPTFHPAAALYNVQLKKDFERDLETLKQEIERLKGKS